MQKQSLNKHTFPGQSTQVAECAVVDSLSSVCDQMEAITSLRFPGFYTAD